MTTDKNFARRERISRAVLDIFNVLGYDEEVHADGDIDKYVLDRIGDDLETMRMALKNYLFNRDTDRADAKGLGNVRVDVLERVVNRLSEKLEQYGVDPNITDDEVNELVEPTIGRAAYWKVDRNRERDGLKEEL